MGSNFQERLPDFLRRVNDRSDMYPERRRSGYGSTADRDSYVEPTAIVLTKAQQAAAEPDVAPIASAAKTAVGRPQVIPIKLSGLPISTQPIVIAFAFTLPVGQSVNVAGVAKLNF